MFELGEELLVRFQIGGVFRREIFAVAVAGGLLPGRTAYALHAGLAFLLPTTVVVVSSAVASRVITRLGLRSTMVGALAIGALGALALGCTLEADVSFLTLVPGVIAISVGDGAMFTAIFIAAATGVSDRQQGVASGIVSTGQGVGAAVGLAVLVLVANFAAKGGEQLHIATAHGIALAADAIAGGILLTLLIVVVFRGQAIGGRSDAANRPIAPNRSGSK